MKVLILTEPCPPVSGCVSWSQFLAEPAATLRSTKCLVLTSPFAYPSPYRKPPGNVPVGKGPYTTRCVDGEYGEYFKTEEESLVLPLMVKALWDWAAEPGHTLVVLLPVLFEPETESYFLSDEARRVLEVIAGESGLSADLERRYSLPSKAPAPLVRTGTWWPDLARLLTGHAFTLPADVTRAEGVALLSRPQQALPGTGHFVAAKLGAGRVLAALALPWRGSPEVVYYDGPDAEQVTTLDAAAAEALAALGKAISGMSDATWEMCLQPPAPTESGARGPKRCAFCDERHCRTPTPGDWSIEYRPEADKVRLDIPGLGVVESDWDDHLVMLKCLVDNRTRRMKPSEVFGFVVELHRKRTRPIHVKIVDLPKGPPKTWKFRLPDALYRAAQVCPGWTRKALKNPLHRRGFGFAPPVHNPEDKMG